jgi:hypothetical protein
MVCVEHFHARKRTLHVLHTMHFIYLGYDDDRDCHLIVNLEQITVVRLDDHEGGLTLHIADVSGQTYMLRGREASKAFAQVMQHTQNVPHDQPRPNVR